MVIIDLILTSIRDHDGDQQHYQQQQRHPLRLQRLLQSLQNEGFAYPP
jgi:hypothetical protein